MSDVWLLWGLGIAVGLFGWLLLQLWKSKPSREEMLNAIQVAIAAYHTADKEADILLLVPVYIEIKHLGEVGEAKHVDNIGRFNALDGRFSALDKKLDHLIDYLMKPQGH